MFFISSLKTVDLVYHLVKLASYWLWKFWISEIESPETPLLKVLMLSIIISYIYTWKACKTLIFISNVLVAWKLKLAYFFGEVTSKANMDYGVVCFMCLIIGRLFKLSVIGCFHYSCLGVLYFVHLQNLWACPARPRLGQWSGKGPFKLC